MNLSLILNYKYKCLRPGIQQHRRHRSMLPISDFLKAFFLIFAIVDPFAALPLFITFTTGMNPKQQKTTRNVAIAISIGTLVTFAFIGKYILLFLNISLEALMIAGGILILLVGIEMVREGDKPRSRSYRDVEPKEIQEDSGAEENVAAGKAMKTGTAVPREEETEEAMDIGIVPLGIPMLAGPGSISLIIVLMDRLNPMAVILALLFVLFISWGFFYFAPRISRLMGEKGSKVMTRIMGLLVAGFAVQFILDGVLEWYLGNF